MKRSVNSVLILLTWPFRLFRKTKVDNFVGGLIFGAIFSLIVNVLTVQLQEMIQRQRILEAVENEITNNTLRANSIAQQEHNTKESYNPFYTIQRYSKDIWGQSSEPLQYISQLDQQTQIIISNYYSTTVPLTNAMLDRLERVTDEKLENCITYDATSFVKDNEECKTWNNLRLELEKSTAVEMANQGLEVMNKFHPTKDRLNSPLLKLILGSQSTRILSGE